jgi:hypothetical protein
MGSCVASLMWLVGWLEHRPSIQGISCCVKRTVRNRKASGSQNRHVLVNVTWWLQPTVLTYLLLPFQGYTIPLDKRLAADGRGLQTVHINENFAKLAEALYIADRKVGLLHFAECSCIMSPHQFTSGTRGHWLSVLMQQGLAAALSGDPLAVMIPLCQSSGFLGWPRSLKITRHSCMLYSFLLF